MAPRLKARDALSYFCCGLAGALTSGTCSLPSGLPMWQGHWAALHAAHLIRVVSTIILVTMYGSRLDAGRRSCTEDESEVY